MNRTTLIFRNTPTHLRCTSYLYILPSNWHYYSVSSSEPHKPQPPPHDPENHKSTHPPQPSKDGASYWEDMSTATGDHSAAASPPPKEESPLSGHIENVQINSAPGVKLRSHHQGQIVGGLLDLLAGQPERDVLDFWRDDAVLVNPFVEAKGREEVVAYWYTYRDAFAAIKNKRHEVVRAEGSDLDIDVDREFKFRGLFGKGTRGWEVRSKVKVQMDDEGRVRRVEDRWAGVIWFPKFLRRITGLVLKRAARSRGKIRKGEGL